MGRVTTRVPVTRLRYGTGALSTRPDTVVVEEPLEIRAGGQTLTVTMRTPGADVDLVHGYLVAEGVIGSVRDVVGARYCAGAVATGPDEIAANTYNVLEVDLVRADAQALARATRTGLTTSSCGVCGTAAIEDLREKLPAPLAPAPRALTAEAIQAMVAALTGDQALHRRTGGTHAAALCAWDGTLRAHSEDIGRHNAVDKVIGAVVREGHDPPLGGALVVSSRASYEIVQKAAMAGVGVVITVSAPSSLAVAAAKDVGITLLAFARADGVNVYSGEERLALAGSD